MIFCFGSKARDGLVRVRECRDVDTRWVGSVMKCLDTVNRVYTVSVGCSLCYCV